MSGDGTVFSFRMSEVPLEWPLDINSNEVYGELPNHKTLARMYEQSPSCPTSNLHEEHNLQVVPGNDSFMEARSAIQERTTYAAKSAHRNATKDCNLSIRAKYNADAAYSGSWSPNMRKMPFLNASSEALNTPTFPLFPLLKSPVYSGTRSPLAMMLLSPFGRKPSEDLGIYLPEHFTPLATLDGLERSIGSPVFRFPSVEETPDPDPTEENDENCDTAGNDVWCNTDSDLDSQDVFVDYNQNVVVACKTEKRREQDQGAKKQNASEDSTKTRKRKEGSKQTIGKHQGEVLDFRNKLERKRRNEMNSKYDKLRECIPAIEKRTKVSKIGVLKSALEFIRELEKQEEILTRQRELEKLRNKELLDKLIRISS